MILGGCGERANFSSRPGFAAYFAAHPPRATTPDAADRALLERWRPHVMLAAKAQEPVDFYADYVAHTRLHDGGGRLVADPATRAALNDLKDDPGAVLAYDGAAPAPRMPAVVYARIDREQAGFGAAAGAPKRNLTFLSYNLVFPVSGLPAGCPAWLEALVDLGASATDWHQLDLYTSVMLTLDEGQRPFAVTMQEHNGQRTWLLDARMRPGETLSPAADGRVRVAPALRSNELYPWSPVPRRWRTMGLPDAAGMRWLMSGDEPPFIRADDIAVPGRELPFELAYLPPDDAFYRFHGWLGRRRLLPGRSGPPGADYNTIPSLKPKAMQLFVGYWRDGDAGDLARLEAAHGDLTAFAKAQAPVLYASWQEIADPSQRRKD